MSGVAPVALDGRGGRAAVGVPSSSSFCADGGAVALFTVHSGRDGEAFLLTGGR